MHEIEDFLQNKGVTSNSLDSYRRDLNALKEYFGVKKLFSLKKEDLEKYFSGLAGKLSLSSLTRRISVIRSFYRYFCKEGRIQKSPMDGILAGNFKGKKREILTEEELQMLMRLPTSGLRGRRDRAMLFLLCETGLRVSEMTQLNREDFTPETRLLTCGKGKRRRSIPLSPALSDTLQSYLAVARLYSSETDAPMFITSSAKRITRQGFWKNMKEHAILTGIEKPISPQTLRRSLAQKMLREGKKKEEIRRLLGNADTASLRNYVTKEKGKLYGTV